MPNPCDALQPASESPDARLLLLDGFVCRWRGRRMALPHGAERLVALLALSRGFVPRSQVSRALFPDLAESHAMGSLRTAVWRLKRLCPGLVVAHHRALALVPDVYVDVRELQQEAERFLAVDDAARSLVPSVLLTSAVDLLPGWYDDWVLTHRERLLSLRVELLLQMAKMLLDDGDLAKAMDVALLALKAGPLSEATHMLIAQIHLAGGNGAEALRQYRLCETLLRVELNVAPRARFAALVPHSPHPLPAESH